MEKIKHTNAKLLTGILDPPSGQVAPVIFQKNGVIRIRKLEIKRKRNKKG